MAENRLISNGLEPIPNHTEKSCIVSYCRQFSTNNEIKIEISMPVLLVRAFGPTGLTKLE